MNLPMLVYVLTEQGIMMISALFKGDIAFEVNVHILIHLLL